MNSVMCDFYGSEWPVLNDVALLFLHIMKTLTVRERYEKGSWASWGWFSWLSPRLPPPRHTHTHRPTGAGLLSSNIHYRVSWTCCIWVTRQGIPFCRRSFSMHLPHLLKSTRLGKITVTFEPITFKIFILNFILINKYVACTNKINAR